MVFDGSDVGIKGTTDIDAFTFLSDGSLLFSLDSATWTVPGVGKVYDEDIVRFVPTRLGDTTAGSFSLYFDGSDVGLTTSGEDIDALAITPLGGLLISTTAGHNVPGPSGTIVGTPQDILLFTPQHLGETTSGTWSVYFDGSDVGLTKGAEDIEGLALGSANELLLTTNGSYAVPGLSGVRSDIFACTLQSIGTNTACSTISHWWRGANFGYTLAIDDLALGN